MTWARRAVTIEHVEPKSEHSTSPTLILVHIVRLTMYTTRLSNCGSNEKRAISPELLELERAHQATKLIFYLEKARFREPSEMIFILYLGCAI